MASVEFFFAKYFSDRDGKVLETGLRKICESLDFHVSLNVP